MTVAHSGEGGGPFFIQLPGERIQLLKHVLIKLPPFQCWDDLYPIVFAIGQSLRQGCRDRGRSQRRSLICGESLYEFRGMKPIFIGCNTRLCFQSNNDMIERPAETIEARVEC